MEIDELFAQRRPLAEILEEVSRLGARLVLQVGVESEFAAFLGRERYERSSEPAPVHRNGYSKLTMKGTCGPVELYRPKSRGGEVAFASTLLGAGVVRSNAFEALVIASFVRGLSVRDVEATLIEALGAEASVSKSTVSRICKAIVTEFDAWRTRSLADLEVEYLFIDASHFKMHKGAPAEPLCCVRGVLSDGRQVLIGLAAASSESTDAWDEFFADLKKRGLRAPLLGISDGAPGIINAFEKHFPRSDRQRCLIHRLRNILAKVPKHAQKEVKAAYWSIFDDIEAPPGELAVAEASRRAESFTLRNRKLYPSAVACLEEDFSSLVAYLRYPKEHWKRIRHSNLIERTFGETRRRVKVIGHLPGETSCITLVWAVLDRAARGWRGVRMTPAVLRMLADRRRELFPPPKRKETAKQNVGRAA
ncbi:MAG: IS256 family transposase [Actinomycetota bacterium]